jgi:plasmid maintenance system antidote protein VapI
MYFGNDAAFWMHLQVAWDMHVAMRNVTVPRRKR